MNDEHMVAPYEPPELVELGEFNEDTLGSGGESWDGFWTKF